MGTTGSGDSGGFGCGFDPFAPIDRVTHRRAVGVVAGVLADGHPWPRAAEGGVRGPGMCATGCSCGRYGWWLWWSLRPSRCWVRRRWRAVSVGSVRWYVVRVGSSGDTQGI